MAGFVAGWNMPGTLPEAEPGEFATFDQAREFLINELSMRAEHADTMAEIPTLEGSQARSALCELDPDNEMSWLPTDATEYESTDVGGYVYWICPAE